jgi:hypothetical protein
MPNDWLKPDVEESARIIEKRERKRREFESQLNALRKEGADTSLERRLIACVCALEVCGKTLDELVALVERETGKIPKCPPDSESIRAQAKVQADLTATLEQIRDEEMREMLIAHSRATQKTLRQMDEVENSANSLRANMMVTALNVTKDNLRVMVLDEGELDFQLEALKKFAVFAIGLITLSPALQLVKQLIEGGGEIADLIGSRKEMARTANAYSKRLQNFVLRSILWCASTRLLMHTFSTEDAKANACTMEQAVIEVSDELRRQMGLKL